MNTKKLLAIASGLGTGVVIGKALKKKNICTTCVAKKAFAYTHVHIDKKEKYHEQIKELFKEFATDELYDKWSDSFEIENVEEKLFKKFELDKIKNKISIANSGKNNGK